MNKIRSGLLAVCSVAFLLGGCSLANGDDPEKPDTPVNPEDPENPEDPVNPEDPKDPVTTYELSFTGIKCTSDAEEEYEEGEEVTIQITPDEGYAYPEEVYVYGGAYSYNKYNGTLKFVMNEDTTIVSVSFEKAKYYISSVTNINGLESTVELSDDGSELVSTYYYEPISVKTASFGENGHISKYIDVDKWDEGDLVSDDRTYTYDGDKLVRTDYPTVDGVEKYDLFEYDEYDRLVKESPMYGGEAYNTVTYEYPDNFTTVKKWYFENFDFDTFERFQECQTTESKITIDVEHNTKRVDIVEKYDSYDHEYVGYEIYALDTGKILERLYSDWSAFDVFEYNDDGDMVSRTTKKYDKDNDEWNVEHIYSFEYNEDRTIKHIEDTDLTDNSYSKTDYECDENGLITHEVSKSYDADGKVWHDAEFTYEYKELNFDLYFNQYEEYIPCARTIGTYDFEFWY